MTIKINNIIIEAGDDGIRLDRWFARYHPGVSFIIIAKLARKGKIRLNGKKIEPSTRVHAGDAISFPEFIPAAISVEKSNRKHPKHESWLTIIKQNILYKDDDILAINKVSGLAVQGGSKISISLDDLLPDLQFDSPFKPKLIHRLDKETSGVILIARNNQSAAELSEIIRKRYIEKTYLAILCKVPYPLFGEIKMPLYKDTNSEFERMKTFKEGKPAISQYKVLDYAADTASLVEFKLITGKTHQLRAHSLAINCPILGDKKYNLSTPTFHHEPFLYLHSYTTKLTYKGKDIMIKAPLPDYFHNTLNNLGISYDTL